ncbi:MAG: hypothetical protein H2056_07230 [Sphingopyxis sp.]|nr:hypothetical protein [Sphingopyxis sp.]
MTWPAPARVEDVRPMAGEAKVPAQAHVGDDQPFLLLANCDPPMFGDGVLEPMLRRMGLQPGAPSRANVAAQLFDGPFFELNFAEQRALAGRVSGAAWQSIDHPATVGGATEVLACVPTGILEGSRVSACRELFKLAVLLIDLTGADKIYWSPAALWSDAWTFRAAVAEMMASGMPPVLHLVAFHPLGTAGALRSQGLSFFAGQEIEVRSDGGLAARELLRRMARLAIDVMVNGAILSPREFPGLVNSERVRVEPATGCDGTMTLFLSIEAR